MVINDKYEFIFLHIPKTAGTSMTALLRSLEGNNTRQIAKKTKHETYGKLSNKWARRASKAAPGEYRDISNYRVIGFVRNPWERMSSLYRYLVERRPREEIDSIKDFPDFIEQAGNDTAWIHGLHSMRPQIDFFKSSDGHTLVGDFAGHFEHLEEDFLSVSKLLNLPDTSLPIRNASSNAGNDYQAQYSDRMIEIIGSLFREDIETFGYDFRKRPPSRRCSGRLHRCRQINALE